MPDYREMYLHLMRETEKAIRILVKAQQDCEELYLQDNGPDLCILPSPRRSGADNWFPARRSYFCRLWTIYGKSIK